MRYETIKTLSAEDFNRSTGVQHSTFEKMLEVAENGLSDLDRPPKLSRADQLLLTLMYGREYRTEFHIGLAYGISKSAVCRTIQKIKDALIKKEALHPKSTSSGNPALSNKMRIKTRL
jgi:DNA-directed RNA polymerase specialized sigma subunit